MTGPRSTRRHGLGAWSDDTGWCRRSASTASRRAVCSRTSTSSPAGSDGSRAIRCIPAAAVESARKGLRRSIRSTIRSAFCIRSGARASAARGVGCASPGIRRWTRSPDGSARPSGKGAVRRSCTTSVARDTTARWTASSRPGGSTVTTRTPTFAAPPPDSATPCGTRAIARHRTTPTPSSSC